MQETIFKKKKKKKNEINVLTAAHTMAVPEIYLNIVTGNFILMTSYEVSDDL